MMKKQNTLFTLSVVWMLYRSISENDMKINTFVDNDLTRYLHIEPETLWHIVSGDTDTKVYLHSCRAETRS